MLVQEDILEAEEVARILKIAERTVKRMAADKQLPGFKVGGQWRFRRSAIERYIERQEQEQEKRDGE